MKCLLFSTLAALLSIGTVATIANAEQVNPGHDAADINQDGKVTLLELREFNRDERQG